MSAGLGPSKDVRKHLFPASLLASCSPRHPPAQRGIAPMHLSSRVCSLYIFTSASLCTCLSPNFPLFIKTPGHTGVEPTLAAVHAESCPTLCKPMDCSPPGSMGFSRQEYWSRLPFPPLGDLPDPRIEPASPVSPALAGRFFTTALPGKLQSPPL